MMEITNKFDQLSGPVTSENTGRKRIIHVINSIGIGGAEILLMNITRNLEEYDQVVVAMDRVVRPLDFPSSVRIVEFHCSGWLKLRTAVKKLGALIRRENPDLVHSHLYYSALIAKLATPRSIPLVISLHNEMSRDLYFNKWYSFYNLIIDRLTYKNRHFILAVSQLVIEDHMKYVKVPTQNLVLYNFIDDRFFGKTKTSYIRTGPARLVSVGNLRHQKNYGFLLETFKQYPSTGVEADIYGGGTLHQELEEKIRANHLPVHLKGQVGRVHEILPGYDAFIMTSIYEGFCIAIVEAMAAGLPLILPDLPIFREVTRDRAFFYSPGDHASLHQAILQFLSASPEQLAATAATNLELVKSEYSAQAFRKNIKNIYQRILQSAPSGSTI